MAVEPHQAVSVAQHRFRIALVLFHRADIVELGIRIGEHRDAIVEAVEVIARPGQRAAGDRAGAGLPGREPVNEWLSGGFALNGTPSEPLIMSIFDPGSPGHDGAVVLHNGSFTMFGVRLPISQSTRLGEEYGTRHHAAMGMSEQSDALVIVVSEERGRVSLFKRGEMTPAADAAAVSRAIVDHWRESATTPFEFSEIKRRKKAVSQMAISLAIALLVPPLLALILGFMVEVSLRRSLILSYGDISCFYTRPITAVLILMAIVIALLQGRHLQDFLNLDNSARMNHPGQPDGNWAWRMSADALSQELRERLREINYLYLRGPEKTAKVFTQPVKEK